MNEEIKFIATYDYVFIAVLIFCTFLSLLQYSKLGKIAVNIYNPLGWIIVISSSLYLGSRTLNIGLDTVTYRYFFDLLEAGSLVQFGFSDILFYLCTWILAQITTWNIYLIFCAMVYVGCAYIGMRGLFGKYALFSLLVFIISPYFFQFGINVMRNGFAASVFIMALYWHTQPKKMYSIMFLSCLCHISMILPTLLFIYFRHSKSINRQLFIWGLSLIIQLAGFSVGNIISYFLPTYVAGYINNHTEDLTSTWTNFLLYGISPIIIALYSIKIKGYNDQIYFRLLNTFLIAQAIYMQVLNAEFALRFEYLGSFLMPILLLYPFLKKRYWNNQNLCITSILLILFIIKAYPLISNTY